MSEKHIGLVLALASLVALWQHVPCAGWGLAAGLVMAVFGS
jgi:hypothetical protein